jgi:predicted chitinase
MLTEEQLRRIVPKMASAKRSAYLPHLNAAMAEAGIDTLLRTAAFLAQLAHESGSFVYMRELWGPTPQQQRYEPVTTLSKRLGNVEAGDGRRYMGRGPIQITGRDNYRRFGALLGVDLEGSPDLAATPEVGFRIAALYWKSRDINAPADAEDFREVTRRINGGLTGYDDRASYYERAKAVFAETGFVAEAVTRGGTRGARRSLPMPAEPLSRGVETIAWEAAEAPKKKPAPAGKAPAKKVPAKKVPAKRAPAKKAPAAKKRKPAAR